MSLLQIEQHDEGGYEIAPGHKLHGRFHTRTAKLRHSGAALSISSTTWVDLGVADLVLTDVRVDDVVEVGISTIIDSAAVIGMLDVGSFHSAAIQNTWGQDGAETATSEGVQGWKGPSGAEATVGCPVLKTIVAGDLDTNSYTLTLRFRARCSAAVAKSFGLGTADEAFQAYAKNLR